MLRDTFRNSTVGASHQYDFPARRFLAFQILDNFLAIREDSWIGNGDRGDARLQMRPTAKKPQGQEEQMQRRSPHQGTDGVPKSIAGDQRSIQIHTEDGARMRVFRIGLAN